MKKKLVSIIIPTRNSDRFLDNCLRSISKQTYRQIETIIVDGSSKDQTIPIAKKYECRIYNFVPRVKKGTFDAPHKRNFGVEKAQGDLIYYVDADMELDTLLIEEAVKFSDKYDALIIPEDSFGVGVWAKAKILKGDAIGEMIQLKLQDFSRRQFGKRLAGWTNPWEEEGTIGIYIKSF